MTFGHNGSSSYTLALAAKIFKKQSPSLLERPVLGND
jgi:hypothetical protein